MSLDPRAFLADPELIRTLSAHATLIVCDTDLVLFQQDDPSVGLYIIQEGEAALSMASNRGEAILSAEMKGGSLLGLPGLISNQPYSLTAVARAGARVSFLARAKFTELMQSDSTLAFRILQILAAQVRSARLALF